MRVITVPAQYSPVVLATIKLLVARIDRHRADVQAAEDDPDFPLWQRLADNAFRPEELDGGQVGDLVITIAEMPGDQDAKVFPLPGPLKVAS